MDSTHRRKYRVSLCITELNPGGAERQFVRLATGLDRDRFDINVICLSGFGALVEPLREQGIPVTCLDAAGSRDVKVIYRLWRLFRQIRPDLVQTFLFHANIAGRVAARLAGVPIVVSGIRVAERRKTWHLKLDRITEKLVDCHVCVSRDVARFSRETARLTPDKLTVIPNEVDASVYAAAAPVDLTEFGFPDNADVILFVGRLDEQKNPELAIEVFEILAAEHPTARLLLVGDGPLWNKVRAKAGSLKERVVLAGHRKDVPNLMKAARCLILPSRWEGMPNVVLEAVAVGLPVVASAVEGVAEALGSNQMCAVVKDPNAGNLARAVESLIFNQSPHSSSGARTQVDMGSVVKENRMPEAYANLYENLFNSRGLGRKLMVDFGLTSSQ